MKHYLGVRAVEDDAHIWNTSSGRWIHDWLKQLASGEEKAFGRLPGAEEIDQRARRGCERETRADRSALSAHRKTATGLVAFRLAERTFPRARAWRKAQHCKRLAVDGGGVETR